MGQRRKLSTKRDAKHFSQYHLRRCGKRVRLAPLRLEPLEERMLLAAVSGVSWIGPANGYWDVAANWSSGVVPGPTDDVTINTGSPATVAIQSGDLESVHTLTTADDDTLALTGGSLAIGANSTLTGSLSLSGGAVNVGSGATLTLAGATNTWSGGSVAGSLAGSGSGTVSLAGGQLNLGTGGATFDFPTGMFQWTSGTIALNSQTLTNTGVMTLANTSGVVLNGGGLLANQGTIDVTGSGGLGFANSANLDNQGGATFDFQADASTFDAGNSGTLTNEGTLTKTGSTGTSTLGGITFVNSGTIDVESGALQNAARGTSTGGDFVVAPGATLDLTGGQNVSYEGNYTGSGSSSGQGVVEVANGALTVGGTTTFDFPNGMFQWIGGNINLNGQTLTNTGVMTLANSSGVVLNGGGLLANQGTIDVTGSGGLGFANSANLDNQAGATFDFQADASTFDAGNSGTLNNEGTLTKTSSTDTSTLGGITFVNSGTIDVESGALQNAARGTSTGGDFVVAPGATLDLTGGQNVSYEGNYTGSGSSSGQGVVEVANGALTVGGTTTFDFPNGMFQWIGGNINLNGQTLTNTGVMTLANSSGVVLNGGGTLANQKTIDVTGSGGLGFANSANLDNQGGATFDFQADASTFDAGNSGTLTNEGTLTKTGSTGTSTLGGITFVNSETIDVESGTLQNAARGTSTGGTFVAAPGARST